MNRKERELKDLLTIKTLEYYKKYSGQNNYVQAQALEDLKVIQKSFESISTSVLMENQNILYHHNAIMINYKYQMLILLIL